MPELNFVSTNATDTGGTAGLVQQPYYALLTPGYNYGGLNNPTGDGFMEFGSGTPGSLPFRVDQAGNVTAKSINGGASVLGWLDVKAYGATGGGTTDDSAAIQAAVTAAGASPVYFPAGTYLIGTPITPVANQEFTWIGASSQSVTINFNTSTAAIPFTGWTSSARCNMRFLTFNQNGTGDLMAVGATSGNRLPQLSCYDCTFTMGSSNTGGSAINAQAPASSNSVANCYFQRCAFNTNSTTRTVPNINITSQVAGGIAANTWDKCDFNTSDNSQYVIYIACNGGASDNGYHSDTVFRDCRFETPAGGAIQSMSGRNLRIENCYFWDLGGSTPALANSIIYIGTISNQMTSTGTIITGCGRNENVSTLGSTAWDIYLEATVSQTVIENYASTTGFHTSTCNVYFNFNGCPDVTIIAPINPVAGPGGAPGSLVITNPAVQQFNSAQVPPASHWEPGDVGYVAWTVDPQFCGNVANRTITPSTLNLIGLQVRSYVTVSTAAYYLAALGTTLTTSENLIGLYSGGGSLLGYSADLTSTWTGSTGYKTAALTAGTTGSLNLAPGPYYLALLGNGTSMPGFGSTGNISTQLANGHLGASTARFATNGGTVTSLPSSFTPASNSLAQITFWGAIY